MYVLQIHSNQKTDITKLSDYLNIIILTFISFLKVIQVRLRDPQVLIPL